jgi:hypothetical protein
MIKYIITKLYYWIVKPSESKDEDNLIELSKDILCGISCLYHETKNITIDLILNKYSANLDKQAEQFSQFLYHITQPSFRQTILDNIKNHSQTPDEVLFYQNVIFNIAMLELNQKNKAYSLQKDTEPVIRPLSVFNTSH